jgi:hypothetical protein
MEEDERGSCPRSHRTDENVEEVQNLAHSLNQAYYMEILKWICKIVHRERTEFWPNWILHHDNAPAHKALPVKQFLDQKFITEMEHPPHSPDLDPYNFWLFLKIKSALKGRRFQDTEDILKNMTIALKAIPQQEFQNCFQQWQHTGLST